MARKHLLLAILGLILISGFAAAEDEAEETGTDTVDEDIGKSRDGSRTDDEAVQREEEAIKLDGLSVAEVKEMRDKAEKHQFQAEVDRMMKLIINSLYKNKEIFLRELISNASDALDKIRFLSLTDKDALAATDELSIKIKADKDNHVLHITDTGIGMTKDDLIKNLGTIAKSGTSEFLNKVGEEDGGADMQDLIGQFGVGFYSSFLVADRVVVTSKHNDDDQHIWESDASTFSISKDPRGNTLGRGTQISLHMKEEAHDFLEQNSVKDLVQKYSQFINFNIFLWDSKTVKEEEPADEEEDAPEEKKEEDADAEASEDEDAAVEDEAEDDKPKTKTVEKTVWDWILVNDNKPIWTRKQSEIEDDEYIEFYKSFTKDTTDPMARTHFTAEGEVTFKSILFIPKSGPSDQFQNYGKKTDMVKMYVRRVFITDNFEDMMPKYLSFVKGVVDSDDLPLNVSRETLQQHKLLKVIKKKLVRKTLDMIKKIDPELYLEFWKEYSTNIKLGVIEDHSNRTRLAKLLRFFSSNSDTEATSLADYIERMKDKQEHIYFMAGTSREEVTTTPFVERLLKKGYEVLYLTEPVDEYCIQSLPEFEGKKFQNVAKEGVKLDESDKAKEHKEALEKEYEPLTTWLKEKALNDQIEKAVVSERLVKSPSALVASAYGWSGNMERIMRSQAYQKSNDASQNYYGGQKKTLEINPRHPLIKELRRRVDTNPDEQTTRDLAVVLYETATLRSSYLLKDTAGFAERIEGMLRLSMDVSLTEEIEEEPEYEGEAEPEEEVDADEDEDAEADDGDEPAADDTTAEQTEGEGDQETCPTCMRHLLSIPDTDGDGTPDHLDNDDDGNGIPDIQEKEEIIEEKDDNDDDDGEGLISRLVTSLKNMAFIEDEEEDEDHDDDDEIDVIDLFKSWMFGDDDDDNDKDDKSNSGNAAERETTGHSYKATKRKLLSVEAFKHEKAPKPVKISDIISNIYDKLFHLVFPEKQSGLTKSTSRSNPKGAADHSKPTRGNSQKQKVIKNWVQTEKPFKISDMVKGLFDSIFGSSSGSKPKTPPRGTSTHTEKVQSSSPPKAKAAKEVGIKNWVQTEKPFKISDFVADVVGSVLPGGAPSPTPSGGRKEEKQTKVTEDATANDNREEEEAKDDDDSMAEKVVIVNWVQTEKPFKISDFIVSLFSTGASTTETVASNPSEDHADTEEDKAKEHEETSETANDENSNEESSQTDESSKNEEISHETDDSSSDVPVKNWKQTVKPFKFSELIGNMFNALFH